MTTACPPPRVPLPYHPHAALLEVLRDRAPIDEWALHMLIDALYPELPWGFDRLRRMIARLVASGQLTRTADGLIVRTAVTP